MEVKLYIITKLSNFTVDHIKMCLKMFQNTELSNHFMQTYELFISLQC